MNVNKVYIRTHIFLNTLKFVHKVYVGIINFICSRVQLLHKMWRFQFDRFFSSYQEDVKFGLVTNMASYGPVLYYYK
jgi:hypothetical protein